MVEGGAGVELMGGVLACPKTSMPRERIEKTKTNSKTENLVLITGLAIWSHYPTIQLSPAMRLDPFLRGAKTAPPMRYAEESR
jgi:hypothetical protein